MEKNILIFDPYLEGDEERLNNSLLPTCVNEKINITTVYTEGDFVHLFKKVWDIILINLQTSFFLKMENSEILEFFVKIKELQDDSCTLFVIQGAVSQRNTLINLGVLFLKNEYNLSPIEQEIGIHKPEKKDRVAFEDIAKVVCDYYDVDFADIKKKGRKRKFVIPRQITMYFTSLFTSDSLEVIARNFDGDKPAKRKNHTTVIHAKKIIKDLVQNDFNIKQDVDFLNKKILQLKKQTP